MTMRSIFFAALLRKLVATKAQRHEAKKMVCIFILCLGDFVAQFNFCKKLFTRRLKYLSLAVDSSRIRLKIKMTHYY